MTTATPVQFALACPRRYGLAALAVVARYPHQDSFFINYLISEYKNYPGITTTIIVIND